MESQKNIIDTFTELAPRYEQVVDSELNSFWGWSYQGFVNHLISNTPISRDDRILDVATGTSVIPNKIASTNNISKKIHGLDITYSMLQEGRHSLRNNGTFDKTVHVCASAMAMPYAPESFNVIICGLATHHMDVNILLSEMYRLLSPGGIISIADVGSSPIWRVPGVKLFLRLAGFTYFLFKENFQRAWAEAGAISNIRTKEDWIFILNELGYEDIDVSTLQSKYKWIPDPIIMKAKKG
jgi:ubiquinone/menaquinone biosynthesis C-methylase UbiE